MPQFEMQHPLFTDECTQDKESAHRIADGCGDGNAVCISVQYNHEEEIQKNVQDARTGQIQQWPSGIPDCAQDGASEVIDHQKGHPEKIDPQVSDGHTHDIFRRAKECEDWLRDHLTENEHEKPADQGDHEAGVKGFVDFVTVSGADEAGQHDIGSDGQTAEEGHNHVDHRRIGADGCHCLAG